MTKADDHDDYLWDGSGEPDPEVVRLESLLAGFRQRGSLPPLPDRRRTFASAIGRWTMPLAAAAALLIVVTAWWLVGRADGRSWAVEGLAGAPVVDGATLRGGSAAKGDFARLGVGKWVVTDGVSRARIEAGRIGRVDIEPNTRLQLRQSVGQVQRMALARGTIHARIWAPPQIFFVDTPSAVTVDLGCEYTLQVDDGGAGLVRVTLGWVSFETVTRRSFIPEGAMCATRPGIGPGTPRYTDAPSGYGEALDILDFAPLSDPRRVAALELILTNARRRDALTLWHLLARGTPDERAQVYDRLAVLVPPPPNATRSKIVANDRAARDEWWNALGYDIATWSKYLKSKKQR